MATAVASHTIDLPPEILKRLRQKTAHLNMLPAVAMQALEVARNPDCSITELARIVERDVKLATDMLAMANSSVYAGTAKLSSLHQAIVRLGLRQCKNLIYGASAAALMQQITVEDATHRERIWRHSFQTAILALHFNHSCGIGFEGEEFTAGLLHDLGRSLMAACLPERSSELDLLDLDGSPRLLDHERNLTGTDHCELGAYFAQQQHLPPPLVDAIHFHHEPSRSRKHLRLVALTAACDDMANHIARYASADGYDPAQNAALLLLENAGVTAAVKRFTSMCAVLMRNAQHDTEQMINS